MTADSGIVTADSGKPGKSVTFARNDRSRSSGIVGHVGPEYPRLYRDTVLRDFLLADVPTGRLPGADSFALEIAEGSKFLFEGQELTMMIVGEESIVCSRQDGSLATRKPYSLTHWGASVR